MIKLKNGIIFTSKYLPVALHDLSKYCFIGEKEMMKLARTKSYLYAGLHSLLKSNFQLTYESEAKSHIASNYIFLNPLQNEFHR